jgi:hypothetical protein
LTEPTTDPPRDEVDYRWVANYQRTEIRSLEARVHELERRLRRRTIALLAVLVLAGSGALGAVLALAGPGALDAAFLATRAYLEPPRTEAPRTATPPDPSVRPAETAGPAVSGQAPGPALPPGSSTPSEPEPSRPSEQPTTAPGSPGAAGLERLQTKAPEDEPETKSAPPSEPPVPPSTYR